MFRVCCCNSFLQFKGWLYKGVRVRPTSWMAPTDHGPADINQDSFFIFSSAVNEVGYHGSVHDHMVEQMHYLLIVQIALELMSALTIMEWTTLLRVGAKKDSRVMREPLEQVMGMTWVWRQEKGWSAVEIFAWDCPTVFVAAFPTI